MKKLPPLLRSWTFRCTSLSLPLATGNISSKPVSDIAFTQAVKKQQERFGSRAINARMEGKGGWQKTITPDLKYFIANQDSFYLGTASSDGQPYIQHRGGPKGFLKAIDDDTLAFADFSGNRQYISVGNLSENSKAYIFLMDYPNRRRVKVWGTAEVVEDVKFNEQLKHPGYSGRVERAIVFHVEAWDVNCPQHIQQRFTEDDIAEKNKDFDRIVEIYYSCNGISNRLYQLGEKDEIANIE